MSVRQIKDEIAKDTNGDKFIVDMFLYAMDEKNYYIYEDVNSVMDYLGLDMVEYMGTVNVVNGYEKAKKIHLKKYV